MMEIAKALPTFILFSPLIGVAVILWLPRQKSQWIRMAGLLGTLPPLLFAFFLACQFNFTRGAVQFRQDLPWFSIPLGQQKWNFSYQVGVDGLSLPLLMMTAIIVVLAAIASFSIKKREKGYFLLFLLLEMGMLGVFVARNLFLFFIFFEVTLVTMFFLIGIWGLVNRERAANQFLLYNGAGSVLMLLGFIGLLTLFQTMDFDRLLGIMHDPQIMQMLAQNEMAQKVLMGAFLCISLAFAIKLPVFPFHTWMLKVHTEAPPPVVMIHSGILLKMGAYGLIRFGVELFPTQVKEIATILAVLGLINILIGAALAFVQKDLRRILAYSSVSHMGIILFGIASLNVAGLSGAVFQAVSHGFISALLFFFIGRLYERTRTTDITELGGLASPMPVMTGIFLVGGLALLGLPGLSGFISEFLAFLGLFHTQPIIAAVGTLGLVLAAVYTLRAVLTVGFGPTDTRWRELTDARWTETIPMLTMVGVILLIGVWPAVLGDPIQTTLEQIMARMGG
ncbi:NADH-quinone oxidoreductase subunit M [Marininema mesophilum]|uniref:NADH-quinone oxidoreductase subunit M n=1 Tax=Marininema mesophilum TaxID=1048340 RepID=A0A1H2TDP1_9BACL|nr:NADH-quinone oxidoreductase subunit M [Marininema mesophilum]SDW41940.1 NADH-quinone oxidoreductase subunit M [Marininema mesophilum]